MTPMHRIQLTHTDITTLQVDAIVNAANTSLLGECRALNGCNIGQASIT